MDLPPVPYFRQRKALISYARTRGVVSARAR